LKQRVGDRRTVDFEVRPLGKGRTAMNHPGDDLFAGTTRPLDEDRYVGGGDHRQIPLDLSHSFRRTKNHRLRRQFKIRLSWLPHYCPKLEGRHVHVHSQTGASFGWRNSAATAQTKRQDLPEITRLSRILEGSVDDCFRAMRT